MRKRVTQDMAYRHSLLKYAEKYGVSRASRKYNKARSYICFWKARRAGTAESLACQSRWPHSHPNRHTEAESKLVLDMRRRNPSSVLKRMQEKLKGELGSDGYMDYGLIICQANGRPIMTEHLNKRFKEILVAMGDPDIAVDDIVFHSIRHTSAGVKLRLSKGDLKAVQGDGGWNTPDMVTKRYAHILDEDRKSLAAEMEAKFYQGGGSIEAAPAPKAAPALDAASLASLLASNPDLLTQVLQSVQFANKA